MRVDGEILALPVAMACARVKRNCAAIAGRRTQADAIEAAGHRRRREQAGEGDDRHHQQHLSSEKPRGGALCGRHPAPPVRYSCDGSASTLPPNGLAVLMPCRADQVEQLAVAGARGIPAAVVPRILQLPAFAYGAASQHVAGAVTRSSSEFGNDPGCRSNCCTFWPSVCVFASL